MSVAANAFKLNAQTSSARHKPDTLDRKLFAKKFDFLTACLIFARSVIAFGRFLFLNVVFFAFNYNSNTSYASESPIRVQRIRWCLI